MLLGYAQLAVPLPTSHKTSVLQPQWGQGGGETQNFAVFY